jgi:hypothetical protein
MLTRNNIEEAIRKSLERFKDQRKEFSMYNRIFVSVMSELLPEVNILAVIGEIEKNIPPHLFEEIDDIFIGSFGENDERALEAHYESGAIYITGDLPTNSDYIENIVHETAHSLEHARGLQIYGDKKIELEFLGKRGALERILNSEKINTSDLDFSNPEYSEEFDLYLYKNVGYDNLNKFTSGLFASSYGATSLREYFANGFEEFFLGNRQHLKRVSPQLYKKIEEVIFDEDR